MQTNYLVGEKKKKFCIKKMVVFLDLILIDLFFLDCKKKRNREFNKKKDSVLVLLRFSPFSISIAKMAFPQRIVSNELIEKQINKLNKFAVKQR
jgi:hypothetical protein